MHALAPGAPMDSSAGLRDRNIHAKRCADVCDQPGSDGHFICDSLVVLPTKANQQTTPVLCALDLIMQAASFSQSPGSPPEIPYSVRFSDYGTFLGFRSLQKIETERRREGK